MEKMMMEFTAGVDIFLNNVREAASTDAQKMKVCSHMKTEFENSGVDIISTRNRIPFLCDVFVF